MGSSLVIIVCLSCALVSVLLGIIIYCYWGQVGNGCKRIFRRKRQVHQITVPARPSGENEIVLAVTQRRENVSRNGSLAPNASNNNDTTTTSINVAEEAETRSSYQYQRPRPLHHHLVSRHHSFVTQQSRRPTYFSGGGSDVPSPLVSLSSLQSLLMSSQVAIFNSSTERLSLSSQNQLPFQQSSALRQQQNQILGVRTAAVGGNISPYSISPTVSSSCVHLPQPSYFDELPPSYHESMLIRKLRASDRVTGNRTFNQHQQHPHSSFHPEQQSSSSGDRFSNSRRSCRT